MFSKFFVMRERQKPK